MTDQRSPETNDASDASVERVLTDALVTRPLDEAAHERLRVATAQAWRAATSVARDRPGPARRWRWIGITAAASLGAVVMAIFLTRPAGEPAVIGSLARSNDGGIEVRSGLLRHRVLNVGDPLRTEDTLTTRGSVLVSLARGGTLRIAAGSVLSVTGITQLSVERGLIYVDLPPDSTHANPLRVMTRAGAVEHVGTEFEVMSDNQAVRIRVREGQIQFLGRSQTIIADAGTELLAMPGGQVARRPVETFGRDWLWTAALAPNCAIEGHRLIGFLSWISRELGRPLEFADAQAREVAQQTILHGSVNDQAPLEALSTVLATTSLTYEFRGDALRIYSRR